MSTRAMYHLQCGDDGWNPTEEELADIVKKFQEADVDPLGRMFVPTRSGVKVDVYHEDVSHFMSPLALIKAVAEIKPGTYWLHTKSGVVYSVAWVTNLESTDAKYVPTVVYQNTQTGSRWSRPLHDWYRSMVPYHGIAPDFHPV